MLEDTININNLCFEIQQFSGSEKKLVKPLGKNCFFGPNLHRKGVIMEIFFLVEIITDHQLSESFYFIKISYVLTEL